MVEYLDPRDGYALVTLPDGKAPEPWLIEVPEGACFLIDTGTRNHFYGDINGIWSWFDDSYWVNGRDKNKEILHRMPIIWQRPTQPEELPFIDDEPRPKPRERVYAVLGDNIPERQRFVINGIDYTKAIQLGAKALQLAIRTFSEAMKQK